MMLTTDPCKAYPKLWPHLPGWWIYIQLRACATHDSLAAKYNVTALAIQERRKTRLDTPDDPEHPANVLGTAYFGSNRNVPFTRLVEQIGCISGWAHALAMVEASLLPPATPTSAKKESLTHA